MFDSKVGNAQSLRHEEGSLGIVEDTRVIVGMDKKLFSRTGGSFPIVAALTGKIYLLASITDRGTVVLTDATGKVVAIMKRAGNNFNIYSYGVFGHLPFATVTKDGEVLAVVMEGETGPVYAVHTVPNPSKTFPIKYAFKKNGKTVASTRYGKGNSYMLTVDPGADVYLMVCLAAIADEIHE